ncbi:hypothetical protein Tco_0729399 [Tanacetum coccineum]|uniref:Uncharacterized protein n=1 Tax=Tanacetum coccineum TaxID=301880 RepID=A0ABQ4YRW7_9ASTR
MRLSALACETNVRCLDTPVRAPKYRATFAEILKRLEVMQQTEMKKVVENQHESIKQPRLSSDEHLEFNDMDITLNEPVSTQESTKAEVSNEVPIVEEIGTQEFHVEDVVVKDYVSSGEDGEDYSEDAGTDDDDDVDEDFLVDEENEIVEPDLMSICYSDPGNDEEKNYRKKRINPDIPVKAVQDQLQRELEVQISMKYDNMLESNKTRVFRKLQKRSDRPRSLLHEGSFSRPSNWKRLDRNSNNGIFISIGVKLWLKQKERKPVVGQDGLGGPGVGVGVVIGLSAAAGEGGAGVASQGSSHSRWTKRRVQTERISPQKGTPTQPASQPSTSSQAPVSEPRNADGREMGNGVPTQSSVTSGASKWSFL